MQLGASVYITVYICVYKAANHRLIGAIRELPERHSIAAPDGHPGVDTENTLYTYMRTFTQRHMVHINADRLTEGILIPKMHTCA